MKRDPIDPDLVYARIRAGMPFILSPKEKERQLGYAERLVAAHPHDITSYIALEMVYDVSFTSGGNRADGMKTLDLLKKMQDMDQNVALRAWDIREAKINQTLLDETIGSSSLTHTSPTSVTK